MSTTLKRLPRFLLTLVYMPAMAWGYSDPENAHRFRPRRSLEQLVASVWTTRNGLPQNTINDIAQGSDGYLWIATQEGVARFDGITFTVYDKRRDRDLPSNHVNVICEGEGGELFLGTNEGLAILRGSDIVSGPIELLGVPVRDLDRIGKGPLWIATPSGLFSLAEDSLHRHTLSLEFPNSIRTIEVSGSGQVWVGTENRDLIVWSDSIVARFGPRDGLPAAPLNTILETRDGRLLLGYATGGLFERGKGRFRPISDPAVDRRMIHHDFAEDQEGTIWVGTSEGLLRLSHSISLEQVVVRYDADDGLPGESVQAVFIDREGSLWTGTFGKGLGQYSSGSFVSHGIDESGSSGVVFCVTEDASGRVWIGSENGGATIFERNSRNAGIRHVSGLPDKSVFSIEQDRSGTMWIGTMQGGLAAYRERVIKVYSTRNGLPNDFVRAIKEDAEGRLWVGTRNGLCRIVDGAVHLFTQRDGLTSQFIRTLYLDRSGIMWVGTLGGGVFRYDGTRFSNYSIANGLPSNDVWSIFEDREGTMWFGTNGGGVARLRNDSLTVVSTQNGLADDVILVMLEDSTGAIWMTSNHGVARVSRDELNAVADGRSAKLTPISFGRADGLKSDECTAGQPAGIIDSRGRLWIPTTEGIATADPNGLRSGGPAPDVTIEALLADGIQQSIVGSTVESTSAERLEFIFTALSFLEPQRIRFRYMLQGYESDWTDGRTHRTAAYTNVPPGSYVFRVSARKPSGRWSDNEATLTVSVEAGLLDTVWFRSVVAFILIGGTTTMYVFRMRVSRNREKELTVTVEERTQALREQKDLADRASEFKSHLLDIASHDLKSPLISIRGFAQLMKDDAGISTDVRESADAIHRLSQSTLSLINELLDASTVERGHIALQLRPTNLADLAESLAVIHRVSAARKGQTIHYSSADASACVVLADPGRIQTVIENLLTNAMKFSLPGSSVWIDVSRSLGGVRVSVRDEGPGISQEDRKIMFEMFRTLTARPTAGEPTTGVGLALAKRFVELHGGTIDVDSTPGRGSTFSITIPLGDEKTRPA